MTGDLFLRGRKNMLKNSRNIIEIIVVVMICVVFTIGCSSDESKQNKTMATTSETEEESTTVVSDKETEKKAEHASATVVENESSVDETISEQTTIESTSQEIISTKVVQEPTTVVEKTTTKNNQSQETTTEYVFEEGGRYNCWRYRSTIYPEGSEKRRLEDIFWDEFGMTTINKEKSDKMVIAMVELVSEIMNTYSTDFERERALYEAICLTCDYDHESLITGLTAEGQIPYGVLVEHKAVCGGYSVTFHIGLSMMGIENIHVVGMTTQGFHGWNKVCLDGEWYEVDVTWGDGEDDWFDYSWFNLTSAQMSATHNISGTRCNGTKYNENYLREQYIPLFLENKVYVESIEEGVQYIREQFQSGNDKITFCLSRELAEDMWLKFTNQELPINEEEWDIYSYINASVSTPQYKFVFLHGIKEFEICYSEEESE